MSRDGCVALRRGAMGLSEVVIVVFPDHTHYFKCYRQSLVRWVCGFGATFYET